MVKARWLSRPVVVMPQAEVAVIAARPGRFTPGRRGTRIAKVRGHQYLIVFREHPDHVIVLAVVHTRSGTSYWLNPP